MNNPLDFIKFIFKEEIARRYFLMNSFDGTLTILGIITAIHLSGIHQPEIFIISSLGAAIAMGVSGVWGAYATERAERLHDLKLLEKHVLKKLGKTKIGSKMKETVFMIALVNGLSPVLAYLVVISPYTTVGFGLLTSDMAFYVSLFISALLLLGLGAIVGVIAKEDMTRSALKMIAAGATVIIITLLVEKMKVL